MAGNWVARGVEARTAARLDRLGLDDDAALSAWLAANPDGGEVLGRVMATELRRFLTAPSVPPTDEISLKAS